MNCLILLVAFSIISISKSEIVLNIDSVTNNSAIISLLNLNEEECYQLKLHSERLGWKPKKILLNRILTGTAHISIDNLESSTVYYVVFSSVNCNTFSIIKYHIFNQSFITKPQNIILANLKYNETFISLEWDTPNFFYVYNSYKVIWRRCKDKLPESCYPITTIKIQHYFENVFFHNGLPPGTVYQFKISRIIKNFNAKGQLYIAESDSLEIFAATNLYCPVNFKVNYSNLTPYSFEVQWEPKNIDQEYNHFILSYKEMDNLKWFDICLERNETSCLVKDSIKPGKTYNVSLFVIYSRQNCENIRSSSKNLTLTITTPPLPVENIVDVVNPSKVNVKWMPNNDSTQDSYTLRQYETGFDKNYSEQNLSQKQHLMPRRNYTLKFLAPNSKAPSTISPSTISTSTISPSTISPSTISSSTISSSTISPSTISPSTIPSSTISPSTISPSTISPSTIPSSTISPSTISPSTISPSTISPSTIPSSTEQNTFKTFLLTIIFSIFGGILFCILCFLILVFIIKRRRIKNLLSHQDESHSLIDLNFNESRLTYNLHNEQENNLKTHKHDNNDQVNNANHMKDFIFEEEIGSGGYGIVRKYRNVLDEQIYAIKVISEDINELIKEVQIMSKLNTHFIVRYHHSWIESNCLYIQMEFCSQNLRQILKNKSEFFERSENQAMNSIEFFISCQIFRQITEALNYLHSIKPEPLIHRDLKPENILIGMSGNKRICKLADFGLSKFIEDHSDIHTVGCGELIYSAPEMKCYGIKYDKRVDVYSLGVIGIEIFDLQNIINYYPVQNNPDLINQTLNEYIKQSVIKWDQLLGQLTERVRHKRLFCAEVLNKITELENSMKSIPENELQYYTKKFIENQLLYFYDILYIKL